MVKDDIEAQVQTQSPTSPRPRSLLQRALTTTFSRPASANGDNISLADRRPGAVEDEQIFNDLIGLLTDNQNLKKSSLAISSQWFIDYLKANISCHEKLFESALNDTSRIHLLPTGPSRSTVTTLAANLIYEVARQLITEKDRALSDIVDDLVNGQYFKIQLGEDEDEDRTVPNQLVFAVIGWLLLIYEIHPESAHNTLHIKNTSITLNGPTQNFVRRKVTDQVEQSLFILLNKFGPFVPELKIQSSQSIMTGSNLPPKSILSRMVCFDTVNDIGLNIEWVDTWALHLDLDVSNWTLRLFRFPSYCRLMFHKKNIHHRLLVENIMHLRDDRREPQVATEALWRELLITYRLLFGSDRKSWRTYLRSAPSWNKQFSSSHHPIDPLLEILAGRSCEDAEAKAVYDDINAGTVRHSYNSSTDFPTFGEKLLYLQYHTSDYQPPTITKMLSDRRDPSARFFIWTNQTLLLVATLTIFLCIMQLTFQIWSIFIARESNDIARQQLAQGRGS